MGHQKNIFTKHLRNRLHTVRKKNDRMATESTMTTANMMDRNIQYYKKYHKIEHEVEITDKDDLDQLFWMASSGDRGAFIDQLNWMAVGAYGKPVPTRFIFPSSLSIKDRHNIHKMQGYRFYKTFTYKKNKECKLNLFIKF